MRERGLIELCKFKQTNFLSTIYNSGSYNVLCTSKYVNFFIKILFLNVWMDHFEKILIKSEIQYIQRETNKRTIQIIRWSFYFVSFTVVTQTEEHFKDMKHIFYVFCYLIFSFL